MSSKQSVSVQQHHDLASELAPGREPGHHTDVTRVDACVAVEQLALFRAEVPERFRIDEVTRRRGLLHIAKIKAQLARRYPPDPPPVPRPRTPLGARARKQAA